MDIKHYFTALATIAFATFSAFAQPSPDRAITWVVPFPAGGGTDFMSRTVANQMSRALGQPIVLENRSGAAGGIGMAYAARATPDGYTVVTGESGSLTINPHVYKKLPYDPIKDFMPIGLFARQPFFFIVDPARMKANTLGEFITQAKRNPGKFTYGSFGVGSNAHLMGELLKRKAGIDIVMVPYKGASPAVQDFLGGQIDAIFVDYGVAKPHIDSGRMKALAVTTAIRSFALPDTPTFQESGVVDYDVASWMGLMAPAGTPPQIISRLKQALDAALTTPEVKNAFSEKGIAAERGDATKFTKQIIDETAKWGMLVKAAKIEAE